MRVELIKFLLFVLFSLRKSVEGTIECHLCTEYGLAERFGIRKELLIEDHHALLKRSTDGAFRGHPKTRAEIWARNFDTDTGLFDQSISLIKLLNKIALEYFNNCHPYILYDTFVEDSELSILQNLFQTFPLSFYHGKIDENYRLLNRMMLSGTDISCKSYILFLSDPLMARKIIGAQIRNKVVLVARSTQWKLRDFLSSSLSSDIINLLVIGESLAVAATQERPYVLYSHRLYADGLGSNSPIVLTSWVKGGLTRPHINLFPTKFAKGFSGHRFLIAAVNQPPYIFRTKIVDNLGMSGVVWEGVEFRLMSALSERLNFSFEIIEPRNAMSMGSGEAIREEVQLKRADIGMAGAYTTYERLKDIDMSIGHSRDCAAFITLASKALPKYRAIMGPFQWPVWVFLTAIYLLGIFPLAYTDRLSLSHLIGNWSEIENMFWYVFGTFTNSLSFSGKFSWSNTEKTSTRLLIGFYWIFTIIITACYTGSIIAFVTLPAFPDTVDSVDDLLGMFFRVATLDRGGWELWFANSTHEQTARLYKKMEFVSTIEEGIGNVTASFFWNYAFLGSKSQLEYLVQSNFSYEAISKRSALHLSEECFAPFQVGYTFPKYSVYADRINDAILRFQQSGLVNKILNEVSWKMQRSSSGKLLQASSGKGLREIIRDERQLTTADTEGMFLLLGAGYLLGALALVSEVIGGFTNKCRQIIKRSRKSIVSAQSSSRNSSLQSGEEMRMHLARKAHRQVQIDEDNRPRGRFPGLSELNLTRATLKELYHGGYRTKEPNIIIQNGEMMLETEAMSTDSSLGFDRFEMQGGSSSDDQQSIHHEATVHYDPSAPQFESLNYDKELDQEFDGQSRIKSGIGDRALHSIREQHEQGSDDHSTTGGLYPSTKCVDESFGDPIDPADAPKRNLYPFK